MKSVFADSFYFLAAMNERDKAHAQAREIAKSQSHRLITSEWILAEVGDAFAKGLWRIRFVEMCEDLHHDSNVTIIAATHELFDRALNLFASRPDKDWSFSDCTSFVLMDEHGISEALTADRHFEQAGFVALLA